MDSALIAAFEAASPTEVLLVTVELAGGDVLWTDGGFVAWGADTYAAEDPVYGVLGAVGEIEDGITGNATPLDLTILCDGTGMALWIDPLVQGSVVTVHLGAVNRATGALSGEPELLSRNELDQPRIGVGPSQSLNYDCITEEARMLEPNEEQRLTDSFHKAAWPGEKGYEAVTALEQKVYWRDDPDNAIST